MGKLRPIEIKYISQGHTVMGWQSQGLRTPAWPSGCLFTAAQVQRSEAAGRSPLPLVFPWVLAARAGLLGAPTVFSLQALAAAT